MGEDYGFKSLDYALTTNGFSTASSVNINDIIFGNYGFTTTAPIQFKKVIFDSPATIVYWSDGSKTVVKCKKDEIFDREKGLAMAISKKFLGKAYRKTFKEAKL